MPTPAFSVPDTLTIYIHAKDLFVILLNEFVSYSRGPIDYGETIRVDPQDFTNYWYNSLSHHYRQDIQDELDHLSGVIFSMGNFSEFIFILQEYSE